MRKVAEDTYDKIIMMNDSPSSFIYQLFSINAVSVEKKIFVGPWNLINLSVNKRYSLNLYQEVTEIIKEEGSSPQCLKPNFIDSWNSLTQPLVSRVRKLNKSTENSIWRGFPLIASNMQQCYNKTQLWRGSVLPFFLFSGIDRQWTTQALKFCTSLKE